MMMHDMRMASRKQSERTASANDVNCLPKAVQHEHRLIERGFHTG